MEKITKLTNQFYDIRTTYNRFPETLKKSEFTEKNRDHLINIKKQIKSLQKTHSKKISLSVSEIEEVESMLDLANERDFCFLLLA